MLIEFDKAYDLENTLLSGQAFRWWPPDADGWLTGVIFDNIVKMRQVPEGVEFVCSSGDDAGIQCRISDYLRLSDDLDCIKASINKDAHIDAAIACAPDLHILRQDPWECMVSFICSPQKSISQVSKNVEAIADEFGSPLALDGLRRNTFPSPKALAEAGEGPLLELGLGFRAKYVAATAAEVAALEFNLSALRNLPREASYDIALRMLTGFDGVGDKVGSCVLLYAMDRLDAFPVDTHIISALQDCYPEVADRKMSVKAMRQWAQAYFGEYAGYAQHWLFNNQPKGN